MLEPGDEAAALPYFAEPTVEPLFRRLNGFVVVVHLNPLARRHLVHAIEAVKPI